MITITLPTQNGCWMPSGNPIVVRAVSNQHGILTRLHYVVTVNVNGSNVAQMSFPSIDPNGIDFDIRRIVDDYLSADFVNGTITRQNEPNEVAEVYVRVDERYWNGTTWAINYSATSGRFRVWMGVADPVVSRRLHDFKNEFETNQTGRPLGVNVDTNSLVYNMPPGAPWPQVNLANFKHPYVVTDGSRVDTFRTFSAMNHMDGGTPPTNFRRYYYCLALDKNMNPTKIFFKDFGTTSAAQDKIMSYPCGVRELNAVAWNSINLYNSAVYNYLTPMEDEYYIVWLCGGGALGGGIAHIRPIPFRISTCYRYPVYNVLYKTPEGGWWQIRCSYKSTQTRAVKTTARIGTGRYKPRTMLPYSEHFDDVTHVDSNDTIRLDTGWLDCQGKVDEVIDMMNSPIIYLVHAEEGDIDPTYIPVTFKDGSLKRKKMGMDGLISYELEFEKSFTNPVVR